MAYPWYSTGLRVAGPNQTAAVTVEKNSETGAKRLKLDVLIGRRIKTATVPSLDGIVAAGEKILQKAGCDDAQMIEDIKHLSRSERLAAVLD